MEKLNILVVEDNPLDQQVIGDYLAAHSVEFAANFDAAVRKLESGRYDLCFLDLQLGKDDDCSGLKLIPLAAAKGIYSVVMSGHDSEKMVIRAQELGCNDFYAKGHQQTNVATIIAGFLRSRAGFNAERVFAEQFITKDPDTKACVMEAVKHAASKLSVMILGPTGSGKTCLGRIIHEHSGRKGPFVEINCSACAEELRPSELFGHKKGSFTDADNDRKGKLAQADKGTLFLDEIGAMSLKMQTDLLKAIEEHSFYPVGSDELESSDFRLVSATLENIQEFVAKGRLRFDFLQRIQDVTITLKPLAERKCDILPLVEFFTRGGRRLALSDEAKACLLNHPWPGNARELMKLVKRLVAEPGGQATPDRIRRHLAEGWIEPPAGPDKILSESLYRHMLEHGLEPALEELACRAIRKNLTENRGSRVNTLAALRISRRRLYSALKEQSGPEEDDAAGG